MQPLYNIIATGGAVLILYFGAKNVLGTGWSAWNIAAFTTFFSCFTKMALKASHAAKLFNAVQKAQVSWARIRPYMITIFGQRITHGLRSLLCAKLRRLPAAYFTAHEAGETASRFVNDVDTVDSLFTNGIVGMFSAGAPLRWQASAPRWQTIQVISGNRAIRCRRLRRSASVNRCRKTGWRYWQQQSQTGSRSSSSSRFPGAH